MTGACWGIRHGESDAERGKAGKFAALGGVLRKAAWCSELGLRAMGPGMGTLLMAVLLSASAIIALMSTLQGVVSFHGHMHTLQRHTWERLRWHAIHQTQGGTQQQLQVQGCSADLASKVPHHP